MAAPSVGKGANLEGSSLEWLDEVRVLENQNLTRTQAVLAVASNNMLEELQGHYQKITDSKGTENAWSAQQVAARVQNTADRVGDLISPQAKKNILAIMEEDLTSAQKLGQSSGVNLKNILEGTSDVVSKNAKINEPALTAAGRRLNDFWAKENTNFRDRVTALTQNAAAQGKSWSFLSKQVRELLFLEQQQGTESKRSTAVNAKLGIARRADLIARTELATAYVQGQIDQYRKNGYAWCRWSAAAERSCGYCISRDGLIYRLEEVQDAIPAHPRCRCALIPANPPPNVGPDGEVEGKAAARHLDDAYWTKSRKLKLDRWKDDNRGIKDPKTDAILDDMLRRYAKTPTNSQVYLTGATEAAKPVWAPSGGVIPDLAQAAANVKAAAAEKQAALEEKIKLEQEAAEAEKAAQEAEAALIAAKEAADLEYAKQGAWAGKHNELAEQWKTLTPEQKAAKLAEVDVQLKSYANQHGLKPEVVDQFSADQKVKLIEQLDKTTLKMVEKADKKANTDAEVAYFKKMPLKEKEAVFVEKKGQVEHAAAVRKAEKEKAQIEADAKAKAAADAAEAVKAEFQKKWMDAPKDGLNTNELIGLANKWNAADNAGKQKIIDDLYAKAGRPTPEEGPLMKEAKKLTAEADEAFKKWKEVEADSLQAEIELKETQNLILNARKELRNIEDGIKMLEVELKKAQDYVKTLEESRALAEEKLGNLTKRHQEAMAEAAAAYAKVKELEGQRGATSNATDDVAGYNKDLAKQTHSEESLRAVAEDLLKRAGLKGIDDLKANGEAGKLQEEVSYLRRKAETDEKSIEAFKKAWASEEAKFTKAIAEQEAKGATKYAELNKKNLASSKEYFDERLAEKIESLANTRKELADAEVKLAKLPKATDPEAAAKAIISELVKSSPITREQAEALVKEAAGVAARKKLTDRNEIKSPKNVSDLSAMTDAVQMFGGRLTMEAYATTSPRAHASQRGDMVNHNSNSLVGMVNAGSKDAFSFRKIQFHELAHHLEFVNADIFTSARQFIERRAREVTPTGTLQSTSLQRLVPHAKYGASEYAYQGKAIDPYVLKDYRRAIEQAYSRPTSPQEWKKLLDEAKADPTGSKWQKIGDATEVISMGVEHLADVDRLVKLAKEDPEHLLMAIGAVRVSQARQAQVRSADGEVKITWADDVAGVKRVGDKDVARLGAGKKQSPEEAAKLEAEIAEQQRLALRAEKKVNKLTEELSQVDIVLQQTNEALAKAPSTVPMEQQMAKMKEEAKFQEDQISYLKPALKKVEDKVLANKAQIGTLEADYHTLDKKAAAASKKAAERDEGLKAMKDSLAKVKENVLDDILISQGHEPTAFASKAHKVDEIYAIQGGTQPPLKGAMKPEAVLAALQGTKAAPAPAAQPAGDTTPAKKYETTGKSIAELKAMAKDAGLKGYSKLGKMDLAFQLEKLNNPAAAATKPAAAPKPTKVEVKPIKVADLEPVVMGTPKIDFVGEGLVVNGTTLVKGPTLSGSTRPVLYQTAEGVGKYVVKRGAGDGQEYAELASQRIYNRMATTEVRGVNSYLADMPVQMRGMKADGSIELSTANVKRLVNEFVPGARTIGSLSAAEMKSLDIYRKVRSTHMTDALLANWDYVGMSNDNIMIGSDGKLYKIDAGGTFNYRAQGALKVYTALPEEIFTLRDGQGAKAWAKATEGDLQHLWQKQTGDLVKAAADLKTIVKDSDMGHMSKEFEARLGFMTAAHKMTTQHEWNGKKIDDYIADGTLTWKDVDLAMKKSMETMRNKAVDHNWDDLIEFTMEAKLEDAIFEGQQRQARVNGGSGKTLDMKSTSLDEQIQIRGTADHQTGLWGMRRSISGSEQVAKDVQAHLEKVYGKQFDLDDVKERLSTVNAYTGSSYSKMIATQLKQDKPEAFEKLPQWMKDLAGGTAYYNKTMRAQEMVQGLPAYEGSSLHRGMKFDSEASRIAYLETLTNGQSIGSMLSFSSADYKAHGFDGGSWGLLMHVEQPKGFASVMGLSKFQGEYEALAHGDQKFRIAKVSWEESGNTTHNLKDGGGTPYKELHVWLEEIDP